MRAQLSLEEIVTHIYGFTTKARFALTQIVLPHALELLVVAHGGNLGPAFQKLLAPCFQG